MKRQFSALVSVAAMTAIIILVLPQASSSQPAPRIGGGYTDVIAIPVNDPAIREIGAALFKPEGPGPFPAVVYMTGCGGIDSPANRAQQKATADHLLAKGIAILIVDSFVPRNESKGVCPNLGNLDGESAMQYATRGSNDARAAVAVLKTMPAIEAEHIFLMGFSLGSTSSLLAIDAKNHDGAGIAGVVAYYPFCYDGVDPSVPVLAFVGDKDDWTGAAKCEAVTGKSNFELVVYPGVTHAFATPFPTPVDLLGHHLVYDKNASQNAQQRADMFIAARY